MKNGFSKLIGRLYFFKEKLFTENSKTLSKSMLIQTLKVFSLLVLIKFCKKSGSKQFLKKRSRGFRVRV